MIDVLTALQEKLENIDPIWEQLPGEDRKWYERFLSFRDMGRRRSLLGVYNSEREAAGKSAIKSVPPVWKKHAVSEQWYERAEAWDAYLALRREVETETERREEAEARRAMLRTSRQLLARELTNIVQDATRMAQLRPTEIFGAIKTIAELQRVEYGETSPAQRLELSGPDGKPVASESRMVIDLDDLDEAQLEVLLAAMNSQRDRGFTSGT